MSILECRFADCQWRGSEDHIFSHLEMHHKNLIREETGNHYYDFVLNDLQQQTYVLSCSRGLYWFCQNPLTESFANALVFGVFHIGQSECKKYTLKLGLKRDQDCEYWGPFYTQIAMNHCDRNKEVYELGFHYQLLEQLNDKMPSRKLRLYFGDFDDSDDVKWPSRADWDRMELDERINSVCWMKLNCSVCSEFIRKDARFCANEHYVCLNCFDLMQQQKKLRCPLCRDIYKFDCSDDKLECWLRLLQWPDKKDTEDS